MYLPGTEADLLARLGVVRETLVSSDPQVRARNKSLGWRSKEEAFLALADLRHKEAVPRRDFFPSREQVLEYWADCITLLT